MKKVIFTALVAAVAIGGAFQGNANSKTLLTPSGPFNASAPCPNNNVICSTNSGPQCLVRGVAQFTTGPTGNCTKALSRIN